MNSARGIEIELLPDPVRRNVAASGGLSSSQSAVITVGSELFEELWRPRTLDFLARSYWMYVEKRSRGIIRVREKSKSRVVTGLGVTLLDFRAPEFETREEFGQVTWPIDRGILVARGGRRQGFLRIRVDLDNELSDQLRRRFTVTAEVENFYPLIRSSKRFSRLGTWIYSQTQLRIHIAVTKGFLRSLENLPAEYLRGGPGGASTR